jgi:hypothetical protein
MDGNFDQIIFITRMLGLLDLEDLFTELDRQGDTLRSIIYFPTPPPEELLMNR